MNYLNDIVNRGTFLTPQFSALPASSSLAPIAFGLIENHHDKLRWLADLEKIHVPRGLPSEARQGIDDHFGSISLIFYNVDNVGSIGKLVEDGEGGRGVTLTRRRAPAWLASTVPKGVVFCDSGEGRDWRLQQA